MRVFTILFLFYTVPVYCGFEQTYHGARSRALGDACVAIGGDPWSLFCNPAGLILLTNTEASFYYSPQPFGISELSQTAAAVALPVPFGVVGAGAGMFGFALYKETSVNVSVAAEFRGIGLGLNICHYSVSFERYGSTSAIGIDAGLLVRVNEQIRTAMKIRNINAPVVGASGEKLPQSFSAGIVYVPQHSTMVSLEYHKDVSFNASARFGLEYSPVAPVTMRVGVSDNPSEYHAGIGIRYGMFSVDYAVSAHQELGWTHAMSLSIRWGGYNEK